jgi:hypothetical protein
MRGGKPKDLKPDKKRDMLARTGQLATGGSHAVQAQLRLSDYVARWRLLFFPAAQTTAGKQR